MEHYDKNKESSYLKYWDANNLYGCEMSQKLPVDGFEWTEETSQFNEDFIKSYNEKSDKGYFLEVDVQFPEKYMNFIMIYQFYLIGRRLKNSKSFLLIYMTNPNMLFI